MLDINFIRENQERVKESIKNRGKVDIDIDELLKIDETRRGLILDRDSLRAQKNKISEEVSQKQILPVGRQDDERDKAIVEASEIKEKLKVVETNLNKVEEEFKDKVLLVPNVTSPKMPVGKDESENVVLRKWGEPKKFDFEIKDHVDLGKSLDIIDIEKATEVSGSRFYYLKNDAVLLQFALINFVIKTLINENILKDLAKKVGNPYFKAFVPVLPPVMIKPEVMKKMDRLDPIDERFELKKDPLILVGSAEHTLGPYHMNEILDKKVLPIRYIGYSTSFRREAGSYGKDTRGIIRVHQFDKLEMETLVPKEFGEVEQDFIVSIQEYLVQQLEIPYQVIQICTGDAGKPDYNQIDINCWIPSQNKYRETHTSDYMTNYQSRRLNTRYRDGNEVEYVHMNDATAFAIGRTLVAILENNQQKDGSVLIPKVLQEYVGKDIIKLK